MKDIYISFDELRNRLHVDDSGEFKRLLRKNSFPIRAEYPTGMADKIARSLRGHKLDWWEERSEARIVEGEHPLTRSEASEEIRERLRGWFATITGGDIPAAKFAPSRDFDCILGMVCEGGFLVGEEGGPYIARFDANLTVLIGERGSGKSTVLNLAGLLGRSISEQGQTLIDSLLPSAEKVKPGHELERRVRHWLHHYGIERMVLFFRRGGRAYAFWADKNRRSYDILSLEGGAWRSAPEENTVLELSMQFLSQGELVRIAESGDAYYVNKILSSIFPEIDERYEELYRYLNRLYHQFKNTPTHPVPFSCETLSKFIDDFREGIVKLERNIGARRDNWFESVLYTVSHWLQEQGTLSARFTDASFENVPLYTVLQSEDTGLFQYLTLETQIEHLRSYQTALNRLKSRYKAIMRKIPGDAPESSETVDLQGRVLTEIEALDMETQKETGRQIARRLAEFLRDLERLRDLFRRRRYFWLKTEALTSLMNAYVDLLKARVGILEEESRRCRHISTRDIRLFPIRYEETSGGHLAHAARIRQAEEGYARLMEYCLRMDRLRRRDGFTHDVRELDEIATIYTETVENVYQRLQHLSNERERANPRLGEFLFHPIQIELRQGHAYREFAQLSYGQKASVLLEIILKNSHQHVLLIDQPEDHLDADSIVTRVAPMFREIARRRQVILTSHNSNLVLALRPPQIVVLESTGDNGRIRIQGDTHEDMVTRDMLSVLEGGVDAFELKIRLYERFLEDFSKQAELASISTRRLLDSLRNDIQPLIGNEETLRVARHDLRNILGLDLSEQIAAVHAVLSGATDETERLFELEHRIGGLLEQLGRFIGNLHRTLQDVRALSAKPDPEELPLLPFFEELRRVYLEEKDNSRGYEIQVDPGFAEETAYVDLVHLRLVFMNLLHNAFRSTERRKVRQRRHERQTERVQITRGVADDQKLEILFEDNGGGIPPEILSKIYREKVTDQDGQDHGSGCMIIKRFLYLNDADIEVVRTDSSGTTHRITLYRGLGGSLR